MSSPPPPPSTSASSASSSSHPSSWNCYRPGESSRGKDDRDERDKRIPESRDRDRDYRSSRDSRDSRNSRDYRDSRDSRDYRDSRDRDYSSSRYSSSRHSDRDHRRDDSYSRRSRSRSPRDRRDTAAVSPSRSSYRTESVTSAYRPREEPTGTYSSSFSRAAYEPMRSREAPSYPAAYSTPPLPAAAIPIAPHASFTAPSYQPYVPAAHSYSHPHPPAPSAMPWRDAPVRAAPAAYVPPSTSYGAYAPPSTSSYGGHQYGARPPMGGYMPYAPSGGRPVDSFGSFSNLHRQDWSASNLITFEKNFYRAHEAVRARSDAEVHSYREKHAMTIFGSNIPKPVQSFEEGCFPDYITRMLSSQGFSSPTAIQAQVKQK